MNYFELLELEQKYDINIALLKKNYLSKQMEYHPDRVKDNESKVKHIEISVQLNEAYKILGDDYQRAKYLLKLKGFDLNNEATDSVLSPRELEAILEEYEIIEAMEHVEDLKKFEQEKINARIQLIEDLSREFQDHNFAKALDITNRLKYLTNLVGNIRLKIKHATN